jgi:hypothetical protein
VLIWRGKETQKRTGLGLSSFLFSPVFFFHGSKNIEDFRIADAVVSADEDDPKCKVVVSEVSALHQRLAYLIRVHVGAQTIRLTPDHPFFVPGRGWVQAGELAAGDQVLGHTGSVTVLWTEEEDRPCTT